MKMQKVLSVLLASAMVLSVVACGNTEETKQPTQSSEKEESKVVESSDPVEESEVDEKPVWDEIAELTMYRHSADSTTIPWFDEYLREELGVTLVNRPDADGSVFATMVASGEMTDFFMIRNDNQRQSLLDADLALDLSQYEDQLPNIFENETYATFLEKQIDDWGTVYFLPITIGENKNFSKDMLFRTDIYKAIGAPEMNNKDDLLTVLKEMQEYYPETAEGQQVYGFSAMPAWDGLTPYTIIYNNSVFEGVELIKDVGWMKADYSGEFEYVLEDNGYTYNWLKWFNEAYQMGLLDPDAITISYDEYVARTVSGRYLLDPCAYDMGYNTDERKANGEGYSKFYADFLTQTINAGQPLGHAKWTFGIAKDSENLEACLRFINWIYSDEGQRVVKYGKPGIAWDYDENGMVVLTSEYNAVIESGGDPSKYIWGDAYSSYSVVGELRNVMLAGEKDANGQYIDLNKEFPVEYESALDLVSEEIYGEGAKADSFDVDAYLAAGGKGVVLSPILGAVAETSDADALAAFQASRKPVNAYLYQMMIAETQEEFDELWEKAKADAEAGGVKAYYELIKAEVAVAGEKLGKYFD